MKIFMKIFAVVLVGFFNRPTLLSAQESSTETGVKSESPGVIFSVEENKLFGTSGDVKREIALGKQVLSIHRFGGKMYVALGKEGVAVMSLDEGSVGTVERVIPVSHGEVTEVFEIDDTLWMKVNSTTAVQLNDNGSPSGPPLTVTVADAPLPVPGDGLVTHLVPPNKETAPMSMSLKIVKQYPGKVTLNKGSKSGVKAGDRFEVFRQGDLSGAGSEGFSGEQVVAVLVVEAVNEDSCLADIWRGDRVRATDEVRSASRGRTVSKVYPRKFNGVGEVETTMRPIINAGEGGFGMLCDFAVAYYAPYFFVDFRIQPLGFGWTGGSKVVTNSMVVSGGYNSRAFAVGVGVGLASVNGNLKEMMNSFGMGYYEDSMMSGGEPEWEQSTKHAFSLAQRVRLGAQEGLNLTVNNTLLYYASGPHDDTPAGFIYASTTGRFSWPVALRTNMFLEGGGGVMGFGFGAIGVFTWLRGNGDAGSIGVSASAGVAGIWSEKQRVYDTYTSTERVSIVGPMFSLGMNYRFGALK